MKTPEEIKHALTHCAKNRSCIDCPFHPYCSDSFEETVRYIEQLESNQSKWYSIKERLPEEGQKIMMANVKHPSVQLIGRYKADQTPETIRLFGLKVGKVTHWMPLPEPPKEDAHENT